MGKRGERHHLPEAISNIPVSEVFWNHSRVVVALNKHFLDPATIRELVDEFGSPSGREGGVHIRHGQAERVCFFPVDLGALDVGGPLASLPFGPLAAVNFIKI